ncbi:hypothetical protein SAMD00023353_0403490 [Rosellinia necatrix]|uniref:Uncharacterized protein n=1 Tax=Rosellinia necatrix TaxID=77044 RepID=A0A1S8A5P9_ROSNE|nr:hypothetical protein SAMD00023353_0403490 [Rosellinia necatrix]
MRTKEEKKMKCKEEQIEIPWAYDVFDSSNLFDASGICRDLNACLVARLTVGPQSLPKTYSGD